MSKTTLVALDMHDSVREMNRLFKSKIDIATEEETHIGTRNVLIEKTNGRYTK
jgi:hypothetical protein